MSRLTKYRADIQAYDYIELRGGISQAVTNKLGKLEDLEYILKNGFTDKNGIFHEQVYLAYVDEEWCISDLETDEWFLVSEVLE